MASLEMMLFNALLSIYFHQDFSYIYIYIYIYSTCWLYMYIQILYIYIYEVIHLSNYIQFHFSHRSYSILPVSGSTQVGNTPRCRPTSRNTPRAWPSSNKVPSYCCRRAQGLGGSFGRCPSMPIDV